MFLPVIKDISFRVYPRGAELFQALDASIHVQYMILIIHDLFFIIIHYRVHS